LRAKLITIIALLAAITLVSAQEGGVSFTIVHNCYDSDDFTDEACTYVVGPIYRFESVQTGGALVEFPENPVPKQLVGCSDDTAITLARYSNGQWVQYQGVEIISTAAGVQVKAFIDQTGDLAIVQKVPQTGFTEGNLCVPLRCGDKGAFVTNPYRIYLTPEGPSLQAVNENTQAELLFCGMLLGCQINPNGICDQSETRCQKGVAALEGCNQACTNAQDSCCNPATDGACDEDCYARLEDDVAVDPDCLVLGENALGAYELKEPEITDVPYRWIEHAVPINGVLNGPLTFYTGRDTDLDDERGSKSMWYARFRYLDFNGKWHYLLPASPLPNWWTLDDYTNAGVDDDTDPDGELGRFWAYPSRWLQSHGDYDKAQFWFSHTPVKEIRFETRNYDEDGNGGISYFRLRYKTRPMSEADPDNDGFSSGIDCHDNNPRVHPGAEEICDGLDNDCDSYYRDKNDPIFRYSMVLDNTEIHNPYTMSYMMPCDGKIDVTSFDNAWMEVKRVDAFTTDPAEIDGTLVSESYSIPGFFGFDPSKVGDPEQIAELLGYDSPSKLPKTYMARNQYLPGSLETITMQGRELPAPTFSFGNDQNGVISGRCLIGVRSSCTCDILMDPTAGFLNCENERYGEAFNREKPYPYPSLLRGDILKLYTAKESSSGRIAFDIYCYNQKRNISNIDEGCEPKDVQVHVCKLDAFSQQQRDCLGPKWCSTTVPETSIAVTANAQAADIVARCNITVPAVDVGSDIYKFYTYICKEGEDCYKFYEGKFKACATKEVCNDGIDNDCDGLRDYDDLDCEGACVENDCDLKEKKWCGNSEWTTQDYCMHCGQRDANCQKSCAPEDKSCEGGCLGNACDTAANRLCANGAWTEAGYTTKCKSKDGGIGSSGCEEGACDTETNKSCLGSKWVAEAHCLRDCGKQDAGCFEERTRLGKTPACQAGACDIYANKYCTDQHEWTSQDYCRYCGAIDSDCGAKACTSTITDYLGITRKNCDYANEKYCRNGQWTGEGYCSLDACGADSFSSEACECTPTANKEEGAQCTDGVDNDCDGYKDCADPDCPKELPGCTCNEGEERACCSDPMKCQGLCAEERGLQKCVNSRWSECEGATAPSLEVCNSADDNCDGSTDEGCGGCRTGETRNCGENSGACGAGVQECDEKGQWSMCFGTGYKKPEPETCDGADNNCDGTIDEGCGCKEGEQQECGTDDGECEKGKQACTEGIWGACLGGKDKLNEIGSACSDGKDNDCDGKTDNDDENCGATPDSELKPVCYDGIQNQDEEQIDCGGPCEPCDLVTCNDRQRNGDEEGIDCGGSKCPECRAKKSAKTKAGAEEEQPEEVTEEITEAEEAEEGGFPWLYIIGAIVIIGGIILLIINMRGKGPKGKPETKAPTMPPQQTQASKQPQAQARQRAIKSKEESLLEKSFEETKSLFRK